MGAALTEQVAAGKTISDAYRSALDAATSYHGHQEGYSGAINSKDRSYLEVQLPPRVTYQKLQAALEDYDQFASAAAEYAQEASDYYGIWATVKGAKGKRAKALSAAKRYAAKRDRIAAKFPTLDLDRLTSAYNDKWGSCLAVELRGAEAKRYGTTRRGERLYVFFGYAPC